MIAAGLAHMLLASAALAAPLPPERPAEPGPAAVEAAPHDSVGILCRDPRLLGEARPDIIDVGNLACGIDDPVRVTSVDGMSLSEPILTGCRTARRLADWLTGVARIEARAQLGTGIAEARIMGSYTCRTQNNAGRWRSEHARGRAVDIGGFTMTDGTAVSVADDWGDGPEGAFLRAIWQKGCGPFATVLGPDADRHHRDHFHLDTSPRGGAPHCR